MIENKVLRYIAELLILSVIATLLWYLSIGALFMMALGFFGVLCSLILVPLIFFSYVNIAFLLDRKFRGDPYFGDNISFGRKILFTLHLTIPVAIIVLCFYEVRA